MPMITVQWVEGRNQDMRDRIAKGITDLVHETIGVPKSGVWVVFEDVKASDWYSDSISVAVQRAGNSKS
jgi:4-oxalocrotonate tautomerase